MYLDHQVLILGFKRFYSTEHLYVRCCWTQILHRGAHRELVLLVEDLLAVAEARALTRVLRQRQPQLIPKVTLETNDSLKYLICFSKNELLPAFQLLPQFFS